MTSNKTHLILFDQAQQNLTNLFASNLVYIFTSTFKSELGLKFCGAFISLPGLGKVTIVAVNISGGKLALDIAALRTCNRCGVKIEL